MFHLATFYGYFWPTLYNRNEKSKILKWFEEIFVQVSGEKQLLQLDEFKKALYTNGVSNISIYFGFIVLYSCKKIEGKHHRH